MLLLVNVPLHPLPSTSSFFKSKMSTLRALHVPPFVMKNLSRIAPTTPKFYAYGLGNRLHMRMQCTHSDRNSGTATCQGKAAAAARAPLATPLATSAEFWASKQLWKRAMVNTLRCLAGCTIGDFSAMWYLQAAHPGLGMGAIMAVSSKFSGILKEQGFGDDSDNCASNSG